MSTATCRPGRSTTVKLDAIEAHPATVFAALSVGHWIETATGWSIKKLFRAARRYRTIFIQAVHTPSPPPTPSPTTSGQP